jgi:hypothetical protein
MVRRFKILEGTTEIKKITIAKAVLKKGGLE